MYPSESHRAMSNHHGKKQQEQRVLLFPYPKVSVLPSEIKTTQGTTSDYGEQHTLEIIVNYTELQTLANKSPTQFQHQLTELVKNTIQTQETFFNKISYFMSSLINFSNKKRFLVNWDISQILSGGILQPTGSKVLFKQNYLTQGNSKSFQTIQKGSLSSIKNVLKTYQRLFKAKRAQHILRIYSQKQYTYIEQLQKSFFELTLATQESSFQREKSKINKVLEDLMMASFCNQFILIVTNILEILSSLHPNKMYFAYFLRFWISEAINKSDINHINKELNLIHDKCIKMASQFESDEKNNEKSFGKNKKQKLAKIKHTPNDDNKQSIQQDQKHLAIRRKINSQQSSKIFLKVYQVKHEIQKIYWVHQKYIKYIAIDQENTNLIQYYRIQTKVIENQMKILRHLSSIKKNFVFKYKITLDNHPENELDEKQHSTFLPSLCFKFQSIKADKDYATRYNEQSRPSTTRLHLWAYLDKDIIYHFILCFATSIIQLEANYIHYLDFSYENFVKFHQIFELIDMQYAYVVDLNSKSFRKSNRQLFQIWLQSSLNSTFSYLIHSSETNYQRIKKGYMEGRLSKKQAVDRCILLMYHNMKKDHYNQFYTLCHDLLSDQSEEFQGFPLSRDELYDIKREIPQQPINLEGFYKKIIKKLQTIYSRYNSQVNLINGYQHSVRKYLKTIPDPRIVNEMTRKRILLSRSFQQLPLEYCYSHDEVFIQEQEVMIRSRKDHILINRDHLKQKQRYLIQFLLCCVSLLQELEKNGLILLKLDVQSFVRSGEAFFLKNFIYLFKVGPKLSEQDRTIRSDVQLHKMSIQLLAKLSTERQNLRENVFDKDTLDNIDKIEFVVDNMEGCQNISRIQSINIRQIHLDQFKKLANELYDDAPQDFKTTDDWDGQVKAKNLANFYTLIEDIEKMKDIVSSY